MIPQLRQSKIPALPTISKDRYENIFNVYKTSKGESSYFFYNINKKVNIDLNNVDPNVFKYIKISQRIPWTTVSYREYSTMHLWWLILAVNGKRNPIIAPQLGEVIRLIKAPFINSILDQLNN